MRKKQVQAFLTFLALFASPVLAPALDVTLTIQEPVGLARVDEPVTVGVPLPREGGVLDANRFGVFAGGRSLPAQFRVLSRWDGPVQDTTRPIRWVLVDFQATLGARETRSYTLSDAGTGNAAPRGLDVDLSDPAAALVRTGAMTVRVPRDRGAILDQVTVAGRRVLDGPTAGVTLVDGTGTTYRTANATPAFSVEEQGPMRVVLKLECDLATANGTRLRPGAVRVVVRLTFYAGQSFARVRVQLENNAVYGDFGGSWNEENILHFDSLRFDLPLSLGAVRTVRTQGHAGTGADADQVRVFQGHRVNAPDDESRNFFFTVSRSGQQVASGTRHEGWIETSDAGAGVVASVRWFWQNYEKALSTSANNLSVELWPSEGVYPPERADGYQFEGARHKAYEMMLAFRGATGAAGEEVSARLAAPLVPRATGTWYFQTEGFGMTDPGDLAFSGTGEDARLNATYARYNDLMRKYVGAVAPDADGRVAANLVEAKEGRYVAPGSYLDWYGWRHFGDNAWGDGYSSNHYDLCGFFLVHYLRLGDRAFWDMAEPHVRQASELGQYWGVDENPFVASISFYEKTWHGLFADYIRPAGSHNWIRRLILYHWLTGDPVAREAAVFNAEGLHRYFYDAFDITRPDSMRLDVWSPLDESRFMTWTLENWQDVYALTGDPRWLRGCEDIVRCLHYKVQQVRSLDGSPVTVRAPGENLMSLYGVEPLIRFHQAFPNSPARGMALEVLRATIQTILNADLTDASGTGVAYQPAAFFDEWSSENTTPESYTTIFNGLAASAYAYVGWVDGNPQWVALAHRLWADGVRYPEYYSPYPSRDAVNRDGFDLWGWSSSQFPGSQEKVFSRQARAGIPYLWVMATTQGAGAGTGGGTGTGSDTGTGTGSGGGTGDVPGGGGGTDNEADERARRAEEARRAEIARLAAESSRLTAEAQRLRAEAARLEAEAARLDRERASLESQSPPVAPEPPRPPQPPTPPSAPEVPSTPEVPATPVEPPAPPVAPPSPPVAPPTPPATPPADEARQAEIERLRTESARRTAEAERLLREVTRLEAEVNRSRRGGADRTRRMHELQRLRAEVARLRTEAQELDAARVALEAARP